MDDYAKYFYETIGNSIGHFGNVDQRKQLREKLNCRSFEWYLKTVDPHMEIPSDLAGRGYVSATHGEVKL